MIGGAPPGDRLAPVTVEPTLVAAPAEPAAVRTTSMTHARPSRLAGGLQGAQRRTVCLPAVGGAGVAAVEWDTGIGNPPATDR